MNQPLDQDTALLLKRVRSALPHHGLEEKRMFGGITLMLNGNMLCCVTKQGGLMVRVGKEAEGAALQLPYAKPCEGAGHKMPGFVLMQPPGVQEAETLEAGIKMAFDFVSTLPNKVAKKVVAKRP